jgi:cell division protein ZapA (FtsZ GTPase activity inhibitor)
MDFTSNKAAAVYFRKKIRKDLQTVSLNADMIRLLLAIDERKSLRQIAAEVQMGVPALKQNLKSLLEQGLIEPVSKAPARLDSGLLQSVRMNLARVIGPIADILVDDSVAQLKLDGASISLEQAAELINHLALEIPDDDSRIRFKKAMLPILNPNKVQP